jgi:hypothetical protein
MRLLVLAGLLACGSTCLPAQAQGTAPQSSVPAGWAPYVEVRLWEAFDGIPVKQFEKDWSVGFAPRTGRNVIFQRNRVEAGVEQGAWRLAWEYRQEALLLTNRDSMELVHLYKQRVKLTAPTAFDVQARMEAWSAQGLRVSRWFELPGGSANQQPRLNLALALYGKPRVRDNSVAGRATRGTSDDYTVDLAQTDINSGFSYPFMQQAYGGSGSSASLALDWPLGTASSFKLKLDDLWSRMNLRNLPQTEQQVNSAVAQYDEQGYINYRPLLSGQNSQVSRNSKLRRSGAATLASRFGLWGAAVQLERYAGETIPTLTASRQFGWGGVSASVETRFKTVGLGFDRGDFHAAVQADRLNLNRAKALGLNLGYRHQF